MGIDWDEELESLAKRDQRIKKKIKKKLLSFYEKFEPCRELSLEGFILPPSKSCRVEADEDGDRILLFRNRVELKGGFPPGVSVSISEGVSKEAALRLLRKFEVIIEKHDEARLWFEEG